MDNKTSTADTVGSNQTSMSRDTADSSISSELVTESKDTSMVDLQRVPFQHLNASTTAIKSNNNSQQFIENVDSNENKDESSQLEGNSQGSLPIRRKSTLIFTDDAADFGKMKRNGQHNEEDEDDRMVIDNDPFNRSSQQQQQQQTQPPQQSQQPPPQQQQQQQQQQLQDQQQQPQQQQQIQQQPPQQQQQLVPTVFKWTEGGSKVFVMGTFTGWRKMIALNGPNPKDGSFGVQIALPTGTHRFKFVVDNEVRISNFIPTATDSSGHFVNYLEVVPPSQEEERLWTQRTKSKSSLHITMKKNSHKIKR
ncbi:unnamed protein product [[Candida] boidinii]|nr:unnamed protein product [[Candida] boidinii]